MKEQKLAATSSKPQEVPMVVDEPEGAAAYPTAVQEKPAVQPTTALFYQPRIEDISLYLSPEDVTVIETIVESYWKAYKYVIQDISLVADKTIAHFILIALNTGKFHLELK